MSNSAPPWTRGIEGRDAANLHPFVNFGRGTTGNGDIGGYAPQYDFSIRHPEKSWQLVWGLRGIRATRIPNPRSLTTGTRLVHTGFQMAVSTARGGPVASQGRQACAGLRFTKQIRANTAPRHAPAKILQVTGIPRTISGKISELAVRAATHDELVMNADALANPKALAFYAASGEEVAS